MNTSFLLILEISSNLKEPAHDKDIQGNMTQFNRDIKVRTANLLVLNEMVDEIGSLRLTIVVPRIIFKADLTASGGGGGGRVYQPYHVPT